MPSSSPSTSHPPVEWEHEHAAKDSPCTNLLCRRPQRTFRPLAGCGVAQRIVVAGGADVALASARDVLWIGFHRLAARRARLPDRMENCHRYHPCRGQISSASRAETSSFLRRGRDSLFRLDGGLLAVLKFGFRWLRGGVMEEFYRGFVQRARDLAEQADPFTRKRLLELAQRYEARSKPPVSGGARPLPPTRTTLLASIFRGSGEA